MEVLERLELRGDELALDAGCGSGRVTAELAKRLPEGRAIAVDGSEAMVAKARERLGSDVRYLVSDAGFSEARCWLESRPVLPERPLEFTSTVTLGPLLAQLPAEQRRPFAEAILEESEKPLVLDYVRLNIEARSAA